MLTFNSEIYDEEKQIRYLKKSVQETIGYLKRIKQELKVKNSYQLKKKFDNKMKAMSKGLLDNSNIRMDLSKIDAIEYLLINYNEFETLYRKIVEEEERTGKKVSEEDGQNISINIQNNKICVIKECLALIREDKEELDFSDNSLLTSVSQKSKKKRDEILNFIERKYGKKIRKDMEDRIKIYRTPEFEILKEQMGKILESCEEKARRLYVSSLIFMGNFFKEFDLTKRYTRNDYYNLRKIGLDNLAGEYELDQMFTEEYLSTLSIDQLTYLNVFWINRFAKEMDNFSKSAFIITDLGLWDKIFNEEEIIIDDEKLKWELLKIDTLTNFSIDCLETREDNEVLREAIEKAAQSEDGKKQIKENGSLNLDFSSHIKATEDQFGMEYFNRYCTHLPESKNCFSYEIDQFKCIYNSIFNAYKLKDYALIAILDNLQLNGKIQNWGIMKQSENDNILRGKYLLIGVDLAGMNMPIRLHIPKDILFDSIHENSKENVVPLYSGSEDYTIDNFLLTSPILMPTTEEKKEKMIKELENDKRSSDMDKLYHHLAYVYGAEEFPEHLKTDVAVTKKGKRTVTKKYIRKYINIDTGEIIDENKLKQLQKENKGDDSR